MSYFIVFWMFLNTSSFFLFWLNMEINLFLFIMVINAGAWKNKQSLLYFFVIQAFCSLTFIYLAMFDTLLDNKNLEYGLILVLLSFKAALFPFQNWGHKFSLSASSLVFFLFTTFQKFPIFFLILSESLSWALMGIVNMFTGGILAIFSLSMISLLFYSSVYMTIWLMTMMYSGVSAFLMLISFYLIFFYYITKKKDDSGLKINNFLVLLSLVFFFSMPPFSMFFYKLFLFEFMIKIFGYTLSLLAFLGSFLILFAYSKFFLSYTSKGFSYNKIDTLGSGWLSMFLLVTSTLFLL